jgi:hypothetical protein
MPTSEFLRFSKKEAGQSGFRPATTVENVTSPGCRSGGASLRPKTVSLTSVQRHTNLESQYQNTVSHMKISCFSRHANDLVRRDLERRRIPAAIPMCLRSLLAASAMLASIQDGHAFTCFASADSVRQENPTAWPSWTLRAPGHEGTKCWYASTRDAAHDHRNPLVPRTERIGAKEQIEQNVEVTGAATPSDTVRAPSLGSGSSFDDRFSPMLDGSPPDAGSKLQRVIDLFNGGAHRP